MLVLPEKRFIVACARLKRLVFAIPQESGLSPAEICELLRADQSCDGADSRLRETKVKKPTRDVYRVGNVLNVYSVFGVVGYELPRTCDNSAAGRQMGG